MKEINRTGLVYSDNHIDPFLRFETADSWNVTLGTGTALHSNQQSFEGSQSLRIENTTPLNDLICTNSNQSTIAPIDSTYGMAIFIRKTDALTVVNGFMNIYKNAGLLTSQSFTIGNTDAALDTTDVWVRFLTDELVLNKGDDITIDFTLKGLIAPPATVTIYVDGIMFYNKERLQEIPPFFTTPVLSTVYDNQITLNQDNFALKIATIDTTKQYFIDGDIDFGSSPIEVPSLGGKGIEINGLGKDISIIRSSAAGFALFTSPVGGSGNITIANVSFQIDGVGSQMYNITGDTGFEAIEYNNVNFNNMTSMGEITGYRQGLEENTGRFGGQPSLTLSGTWLGGYRITTSIVRGIDNAMADALFKEGIGFTMASRFLTDINADLGTLAPLIDFQSSNFVNSSLLELIGCIITRNGISDSTDTSIYPNINQTDIASAWKFNKGLPNTFVGGKNKLTAEVATVIVSTAFVDLLGTFTPSDLQHFDSPSNGQLKHLGEEPLEYNASGFFKIEGVAGDLITLRYTVWDDSASVFVPTDGITLEIINNQGPSNNFTVTYEEDIILDKNDFIKMEVSNANSANVTAKLDSRYNVKSR